MKESEAKFPTKLIWEFWGWEPIKALRTSTQFLFVFSKGLCSVPFPNSSSTALFVRPDISSGGSLTNIFRNNLHGGSHAAPSLALQSTEYFRFCQSWLTGQSLMPNAAASDFNHSGCHLDVESWPGSEIKRYAQWDCTALKCYLDKERFLFTDDCMI